MSYNNEYIEWSEWDSEKNNCLENNNFIDFINNNSIGFQPSTPIESKSINSWIRILSLIGKAILTSFPVSSSYTSIGPSSNIDDIVTFIQDEFSTKISNEINKIKPNAWEQRKFNVIDEDGSSFEITTYNPVTDINAPVNVQKSFTDKDTYSFSDTTNSYSFAVSFKTNSSDNSADWFMYVVCGDPSLTINDYKNLLTGSSKNAILFVGAKENDSASIPTYCLLINCDTIKTTELKFYNSDLYIDTISVVDDKSIHSILTSSAVDQYYLKKIDASNTYLKKTDASNTYATKSALKRLENDYFDADLTTAGLAKIQSNVTIGTSITLVENTDFIKNIYNTDLAHKTAIFTLYRDEDEEIYISSNIKLDIVNTTDYYSNNDQPHIWFTGLGVIKLGSASAPNNNYLCYIVYDTISTRGLMITPVQKLN